jgi:hypothetical protein
LFSQKKEFPAILSSLIAQQSWIAARAYSTLQPYAKISQIWYSNL